MSKKQSPSDAIKELYSLQLESGEVAFIFLGYSGVLLRTEDVAIAFDPGKSLDTSEISEIKYLDILCFTHNHWDHFNVEVAEQLYKQTSSNIVADSISAKDLTDILPPEKLTIGDSKTSAPSYEVEEYNVVALPGIHVGPLNQYIVDIGGLRIYHGGDSGYWRHKDQTADVVFVPIGTATTCAPGVALAMVMNLQPKVVVAIHGNRQDMREFRNLMSKVFPDKELIVPDRFKPIKFAV